MMLFLCLLPSIAIIRDSDPPPAVLTLPLLLFHTSSHTSRGPEDRQSSIIDSDSNVHACDSAYGRLGSSGSAISSSG